MSRDCQLRLIIDGHTIDIVFPEKGNVTTQTIAQQAVSNMDTRLVQDTPRIGISSVRTIFDAFSRESPYSISAKDARDQLAKFGITFQENVPFIEAVPNMLYLFKSQSDSGKYYVIQFNGNLRRMMCSCPTGFYRFPASCKHVLKLEELLVRRGR